jgi:hypothetical protein
MKTVWFILLAILFAVAGIMAVIGFFAIEWLDSHKDWMP